MENAALPSAVSTRATSESALAGSERMWRAKPLSTTSCEASGRSRARASNRRGCSWASSRSSSLASIAREISPAMMLHPGPITSAAAIDTAPRPAPRSSSRAPRGGSAHPTRRRAKVAKNGRFVVDIGNPVEHIRRQVAHRSQSSACCTAAVCSVRSPRPLLASAHPEERQPPWRHRIRYQLVRRVRRDR